MDSALSFLVFEASVTQKEPQSCCLQASEACAIFALQYVRRRPVPLRAAG